MSYLKKIISFLADRRGAIDDFGINFAGRVLRKFYDTAITPAVTNRDYEGEIKAFGDRIRILSFLHDISTATYTAGSDMSTQTLFDTTDELVINQQRYYNFSVDKVETLFTYASDLGDALIENSAKEVEKQVDNFVLSQMAAGVRAGNWLGQNARIAGSAGLTQASIATTATGGTLSVQTTSSSPNVGSAELPDGTLVFAGFSSADLGKGVRLTSGATWATEWYRITAVTDSGTASIVNWDDSTDGFPIPNGDILRGLYGGRDFTSDVNGDGKPTSQTGWGWEFQAAIPSTVTSSNIYDHFTMLDEILNKDLNPTEDRHVVLPYSGKTMLLQSSELQPTGIEPIYAAAVVNGKVFKNLVCGFDVHVTSQGRFSTVVGHSTATGTAADTALVTGTTGYCFPAFHRSFCTFAFKWSETRTVDAENQFAKKYQGLYLYGAKVPILRKSAGALLYSQAL